MSSWLLGGLTLSLVGCDQGTKQAAVDVLNRKRGLTLFPGILDLRYTENHDTAFSMLRSFNFEGKMAMLTIGSSLSIVGVLFLWWNRRNASWLEQSAYAMLVAGGLGNILDRASRGFVVDFIHLHRWPVFNVADIAITIGMILGLIVFARRSRAPMTMGPA
ncbi:MAG: signal peptidase II [Polyangiaceae bacterium]